MPHALAREERRGKRRHDRAFHQAEQVELGRRPGMEKRPIGVDHVARAVDDRRVRVLPGTENDGVERVAARGRLSASTDPTISPLQRWTSAVEALSDTGVGLRDNRHGGKPLDRAEVFERAVG